jgi:hypothetical protein
MPATRPLDTYLDDIARIRSLPGTKETSFYPAVAVLLNQIGGELRPRVYCLHHPSGGDGIPDFGLFEQTSFRRGEAPTWKAGILPDRGVIEVKGAARSIASLLASDQVRKKYLPSFGLVLATNLWQFRLLDKEGRVRETFDLAEDEKGFWWLVNGKTRDALADRFAEFLQRCLLTSVPLARPADVAFFLASYAREALTRLEERATLPALSLLRQGMEKALGVAFDSKDGEHLFRSTLVQTLFYGVFSAWVAHSRSGGAHFDWRAAQWSMTVPVARFLFTQAAAPDALQPLELVPLLYAAAETLNRVDKNEFFATFSDAQAVQYFYEPFLEYFDPVLRRQLGVWYTPSEIVSYMVERVDRVLRTELGRAGGLADPDVWVLDPCCGTGSYIVEALRRIRRTLDAQGLGDAAAERLKHFAMTRVVGFEIMTAPFTIAHWQIGEMLRHAGAALGEGERAAVYLTNALTGWETAEDAGSLETVFDTLVQERAAAITVKQNKPILVVLGNPPYNAFAGVSPESEGGLVEPYKEGLQDKWRVHKFNLDDLYVRFYRIAERRITERTGQGIICFISNYSWLSYSSFVVMRERLLSEFDTIWIDNLNGDSRETGKLTPTGDPDPSVFSTEINREGIRVGTCTATLVRRVPHNAPAAHYRAFWGVNKRAELLASLDAAGEEFTSSYVPLVPTPENRFLLRPVQAWRPIPNGPASTRFRASPIGVACSR